MSKYTKSNPWKMWPKNLPCFCGSGKTAKLCLCMKLMPQWISDQDMIVNAKDKMILLAHVRTLLKSGIRFTDERRSEKMMALFSNRDGVEYSDTSMKRKGDEVLEKRIDNRLKSEFEKRSIDLDSEIVGESINERRVGGSGVGNTVDGERSAGDAPNKFPSEDSGIEG
jgi:hypothetical protein